MKTNITLKSIAFLYTAGSLMPLSAQEGQQERPNFCLVYDRRCIQALSEFV